MKLTWIIWGSLIAASVLAVVLDNCAKAETFQGIITQIDDGDTVAMRLDDGRCIVIRLADMDAPEVTHKLDEPLMCSTGKASWLKIALPGQRAESWPPNSCAALPRTAPRLPSAPTPTATGVMSVPSWWMACARICPAPWSAPAGLAPFPSAIYAR